MIRKARNKYVSCSSRIHDQGQFSYYINKITLFFVLQVSLTRKKLIYLHAPAKALIGSELRVTSLQGEIQEFFIGVGGGPNFGSERTVELFCGKLLFPTPPPTSHWVGRDDYVFLNLWKPVAVGRLLRVPKDTHIFEYPLNLVWWQNTTRVSLKNPAS